MTRPETEYDKKIAELEAAETELRLQRHGLEELRAKFLCPFKVGDILINEKGKRVIVRTISPSWGSYLMKGNMLRKDGSEGRLAKLYDWDNWRKYIKA